MLYCAACGYGNPDGASFCYSCGQATTTNAPAPPRRSPFPRPVQPQQPPPPGNFVGQTIVFQQAAPQQQPGGSGMGTAGMILGIIGIVFAFIPFVGPFVSIPCIAIGLPLSVIGFFLNLRRNQGKGMAIAGIVCNGFALAMTVISISITVSAVNEISNEFGGSSSFTSTRSASSGPSDAALSRISSGDDSTVSPSSFVGEGNFVVGVDIAPGRYRTAGPGSSAYGPCTFARLRTAGVSIHNINEVLDIQQLRGPATVTILKSDGGFYAQNCKEWTPVSSGRRTASPTARPTDSIASIVAASNATHVAKATPIPVPTARPASTVAPSAPSRRMPTLTSAVERTPVHTPTQDIWTPQEKLGAGVLLVGAVGNLGAEPGTYKYWDDNGDDIVQGDNCYLTVNRGEFNQERIDAVAGEPFIYFIQHRHKHVSFTGDDGGCTGDSSIGYGLYRTSP